MSLILDAAYLAGLTVASPYVAVRLLTSSKYRHGLRERLGRIPERDTRRPAIWMHAASAGETLLARPFVDAFRDEHPDWDVVVTSSTATGRGLADKHYPDAQRHYIPLDLSWIVRGALDRIAPRCLLLVEREIWPNLVMGTARRGIPVIVINGRLSARSLGRYQMLGRAAAGVLARVSHFFLQNEEYADRYRSLGVDDAKLHVVGNMKYDSLPLDGPTEPDPEFGELFGIGPGEPVFVAGSTHAGEEGPLLSAWAAAREECPALRLIVAPRYIERAAEVEAIARKLGIECVRRSAMTKSPPPDQAILLDTVGELARTYSLSTIVFVGGSLIPRGGHNLMEPAAAGKALLFGPHVFNTQDVADLLTRSGAACQVDGLEMLTETLHRLLADRGLAADMGRRGREAIRNERGATGRTLSAIRDLGIL